MSVFSSMSRAVRSSLAARRSSRGQRSSLCTAARASIIRCCGPGSNLSPTSRRSSSSITAATAEAIAGSGRSPLPRAVGRRRSQVLRRARHPLADRARGLLRRLRGAVLCHPASRPRQGARALQYGARYRPDQVLGAFERLGGAPHVMQRGAFSTILLPRLMNAFVRSACRSTTAGRRIRTSWLGR